MNDVAHESVARSPATLSQAQVEALTRSGPASAEIARLLEAHRPAAAVEEQMDSRIAMSEKDAPIATSPEHAQEILGSASRHAETRADDDIRGARPELEPPDA